MADPTYPLFPVFAMLGFLLAIIPLPWHLEAWNSGTCYYMMWAALACLNQFVNSIVWAGNAFNSAPAWCEVSIRIMIGASVGIPAASLCISRRLYLISSIQAKTRTFADKRRAVLIDTVICVVLPLMFIALQYVSQGHRFDIYEDIGCMPYIYSSLVAYVTNSIWPIVIGLISAVYCVLSIRAFLRQRTAINEFLSSNGSITRNRYFRLMALASTEILCTVPLASIVLYINVLQGVVPYTSWEDVHFNFSRVGQFPALLWRQDRAAVLALEMNRWMALSCAYVFFLFFGFAEEARKNYWASFRHVRKLLGCPAPTPRVQRACRIAPAITFRASPTLSLDLRTTSSSSSFVTAKSDVLIYEPPSLPPSSLPAYTSHVVVGGR